MNLCPAGGWVVFVFTLALPAAAVAAAETAYELREATYLAANCTNCHSTSDKASGAIPSLTGHSRGELTKVLLEFRDGLGEVTIMHHLARGYSDAQIDLLALFFARPQAVTPRDAVR